MNEGQRGVGTRLYVTGGREVRREYAETADSGKRMWNEIAAGQRSAHPALRLVSQGVTEVKDGVRGMADEAGAFGRTLGVWGAVGVAAAAGVTAVSVAVMRAREAFAFMDEIDDAATKLNVGSEALQEFRYAMRVSGGDVGDADKALKDFTKSLGAAESGLSPRVLKAFQSLGFTQDQLKSYDTVEDALQDVIDRISALDSEAERAAVAEKLGLSAMLPLLRDDSAALADLREEARALGVVIDDDIVKRGAEANDKLETMWQIIDVKLKTSFVELAPQILAATNELVEFVDWLAEATKDRRFKITMETAGGFPEAFLKGGFIGAGNYLHEQGKKARQQIRADQYDAANPWFMPEGYAGDDDPDSLRATARSGGFRPPTSGTSLNVPSRRRGGGSGRVKKATPEKIEIEVLPAPVTAWDVSTGERMKAPTADDIEFERRFGFTREEARNGVEQSIDTSPSGFVSSQERVHDLLEPMRQAREGLREEWRYTIRGGLESAVRDGWPGLARFMADELSYRLMDRVTEWALDALFPEKSSGGGLLGDLLGLGKMAFGGPASSADVPGFMDFALSGGRRAAGGSFNAREFLSLAEHGPEAVVFGRPGQVFPAEDTRRMLLGASDAVAGQAPPVQATVNIVLNAQGAGPREVDVLRGELRQLKQELPGTIVSTVNDAQERRMIRG